MKVIINIILNITLITNEMRVWDIIRNYNSSVNYVWLFKKSVNDIFLINILYHIK